MWQSISSKMSYDNPSYDGPKKLSSMESEEQISFGSSKAKKREPILIVLLIVLAVISLAFIILYAKERDDSDGSGSLSEQGLWDFTISFSSMVW